MAKQNLGNELDLALEAVLAGRERDVSGLDPRIASLLSIVEELTTLPREIFRARLKADLSKAAERAADDRRAIARSVPERPEPQSLTLYLTVRPAAELIEFVRSAFGAEELFRGTGSLGGIHAEVRIGNSILMIGGGPVPGFTSVATALHLYVPDADAVYRRALAAGARSIEKPVDQPYGDREAGVEDIAGNHWYIATHRGASYVPEGLRSLTAYLHPRGAPEFIAFLERAFGAEEIARYQSSEGVVQHATVRIGGSVIEMGEAHGPYQPMPAKFVLSVSEADAAYERALAAGAVALEPPSDQPYGVRSGSIQDPAGNTWYLHAPLAKNGEKR